jgi:hypothetical protein
MPSGLGLAGTGQFGQHVAHMPPLGPERTREILAPYEKPKPLPLGLSNPVKPSPVKPKRTVR